MPRFFEFEQIAYGNQKSGFKNVEFRKNDLSPSDGAEKGDLLEIIPMHIKNPPVIQFMAFLTSLGDNFNSTYSSEQPFGRVDPYYVWKSAKRSIKIAVDVLSSSRSKALDNLNNLSWFLSSLYPAYREGDNAASIAASPLFRVKYSNIISSRSGGGQGLLGVIQGVSVTHDVNSGYIFIKPKRMNSSSANIDARLIKTAGFQENLREGDALQIPKKIGISFSLDVVHDHDLGWDVATGEWRGGSAAAKYPYGFGLLRDAQPDPGAGSPAGEPSGSPANNEQTKIAGEILNPN
tara:strand:- start:197 stop:1072 length:876 start_codon:yes stop_codon:yes gene_type:complete